MILKKPNEENLSPHWLKPMANNPPRLCTLKATGSVPKTAAPWVQPAVQEFAQKGIYVLKTDPRAALRWKDSLIFDGDVGNLHSAWDWAGNSIAPYSKDLRTAKMPSKIVEDLEALFSQLDFDLFFCGILGCPVMVVNCRPVQSTPHGAEGFGPQSWHEDGCPTGVIRGVLYLTDVDETTGPFQYKGPDGSINTVLGSTGDFLIFDAMRLSHRALPPSKKARTALDFVIMPRLEGEKMKVVVAGMNHWPADPFCFAIPSDKTGLRSGAHFSENDTRIPALAAERQAVAAERKALREEIETLRKSASWRVTQPFRQIAKMVRGSQNL